MGPRNRVLRLAASRLPRRGSVPRQALFRLKDRLDRHANIPSPSSFPIALPGTPNDPETHAMQGIFIAFAQTSNPSLSRFAQLPIVEPKRRTQTAEDEAE